jgi:hypothetical protein
MSIPLVQKAEKDDINTSIIAIKRNIERINMLLGLSNSEDIDTSEFVKKSDIVDEVTVGNMQSVTSNAVAKAMSYSTEEQFTGKYWIDGKKIYRLVSVADRTLDGADVQVTGVFPQAIADVVETMIKFTAVGGRSAYPSQSGSAPMTCTFNAWQSKSDNKNIYCNASNRIYSTSVIVEYTKTTE